MRVGFTGTRHGMTVRQADSLNALVSQMLRMGEISELHHGDCVGADEQAHYLACYYQIPVIIHPPSVPYKRAFCQGAYMTQTKLPYLERNRRIVDDTDSLIAAPREFAVVPRSGTWATVGYAQDAGKPVFYVFPDGNVNFEDTEIPS